MYAKVKNVIAQYASRLNDHAHAEVVRSIEPINAANRFAVNNTRKQIREDFKHLLSL